mmetsp:Transcript_108523/g.346332  ORF Transcript_108523/g.346332 Transcript_108523/m.346332 type:complete len:210 (+) Transcript_108523:341-970(+)
MHGRRQGRRARRLLDQTPGQDGGAAALGAGVEGHGPRLPRRQVPVELALGVADLRQHARVQSIPGGSPQFQTLQREDHGLEDALTSGLNGARHLEPPLLVHLALRKVLRRQALHAVLLHVPLAVLVKRHLALGGNCSSFGDVRALRDPTLLLHDLVQLDLASPNQLPAPSVKHPPREHAASESLYSAGGLVASPQPDSVHGAVPEPLDP